MGLTVEDLNRFHQFAVAHLADAGAESFEQLLTLWREQDPQRDLEGIRRGLADADAGRVTPLSEAFSQVRDSLRENS